MLRNRLEGLLFATLAALLFLPAFAHAAKDRGSQEVLSYTLNEPDFAKFLQATKNLAALPSACDEEVGADAQSVDQMVVKLDAVPGAIAAVKAAGLTTREYVVISWSILHNGLAAWALKQPGGKLPADATKANVDFYNKHEPQLEELGKQTENENCGKEPDEEEGGTG